MPAGTCEFADTSTSRTLPCTVAVSELSIFMLSVTATTSPACTSSPAETGIATTTPGPWLRMRPPSSREMRCGTPLTSTSRSASWSAVTCGTPARRTRAVLGQRLHGRLDADAVDLDEVAARRDLQTVKR